MPYFNELLGVELATSNQYAIRYSNGAIAEFCGSDVTLDEINKKILSSVDLSKIKFDVCKYLSEEFKRMRYGDNYDPSRIPVRYKDKDGNTHTIGEYVIEDKRTGKPISLSEVLDNIDLPGIPPTHYKSETFLARRNKRIYPGDDIPVDEKIEGIIKEFKDIVFNSNMDNLDKSDHHPMEDNGEYEIKSVPIYYFITE